MTHALANALFIVALAIMLGALIELIDSHFGRIVDALKGRGK